MYGKVGMTCIANSMDEARAMHEKAKGVVLGAQATASAK
jgi:hypothetical protein